MVYLIVLFRAVTVLIVFQLVVLLTGRRTVMELPVIDFIIAVTIGAVAGADLADHRVPHLPTLFAIALLGGLQVLFTRAKIRWKWFGAAMTFEPVVVVQDGLVRHDNLAKLRYSVRDLMPLLRQKGVFDIGEVKYALLEPSGQLSLIRRPEKEPPTRAETGIAPPPAGLPRVVVFEGEIDHDALESLGMSRNQLERTLSQRGHGDVDGLFLVTMDETSLLRVVPYDVAVARRERTNF